MDLTGIKQIRKRIDTDLSNFKNIYGCYVNAGEVVAKFAISTLDMTQEEKEIYSKLLKKGISGKQDKNLLEIELEDSENQKSLYTLVNSRLDDSSLRDTLYERIIESIEYDKNYCILLAFDSIDTEEETFSYFMCDICPIKETKAELRYAPQREEFRSNSTGNILAPPFLGFMYPSYTDGAADIYSSIYYFGKEVHEEVVEGVFAVSPPKSAAVQKEEFHDIMQESLADDYNLETTAFIQSKLAELKDTEDTISSFDIKDSLLGIVDEDKLDSAVDRLEGEYLIDTLFDKKFQVSTTSTTITTEDPASLKLREIDGRSYILVPASGVTVNGREL